LLAVHTATLLFAERRVADQWVLLAQPFHTGATRTSA